MAQLRLLIVDKHPIIRQAIRTIIQTEDPTILIAGEAGNEPAVVGQVNRCQPDIVLLDFLRSSACGVEIIAKIKRDRPQIKVIVLTQDETLTVIKAALDAGADGYLLKDIEPRAIIQAIQAACRDELPLHPRVAQYLFRSEKAQTDSKNGDVLTAREKEVLALVTQGLSNEAVAHRLHLTEGRVNVHISRILDKLQVSPRTEVAIRGHTRELISMKEKALDLTPT